MHASQQVQDVYLIQLAYCCINYGHHIFTKRCLINYYLITYIYYLEVTSLLSIGGQWQIMNICFCENLFCNLKIKLIKLKCYQFSAVQYNDRVMNQEIHHVDCSVT